MAETSDPQDFFKDHLIVRQTDGQSTKFTLPEEEGEIIRIGRELDNDLVLSDPRSSRYHAEIRRVGNSLQIKDLQSANGTMVGTNRLEPEVWQDMAMGQTVQVGETRLIWEQAASTQATTVMRPQPPTPAAVPVPVPAPAPAAAAPPAPDRRSNTAMIPWLIGLGLIVLILLLAALFLFFGGFGGGAETAGQPSQQPADQQAVPAGRTTDGGLSQQTPGSAPADTPTPEGPRLAIPSVRIVTSEVRPIVLGALPSTDKALLLVNVRVENVGNADFTVSTDDFSVRTSGGQTLSEAGGSTSLEGLRRLGAVDRFNDLNLTPGGSVAESLIFEVAPLTYQAELVFEPPDADPIVLGLGSIEAGKELALALGTPVAEETPLAVAGVTPTATPEPTPTPTRPPVIPAPLVVPRSALAGTIAYPVYNGRDFDIYFGQAETGETRFFRGQASQPAFSPDGSRIAFHSWSGEARGLVTMDVSGANPTLVTNFIEDQLPTWTADGQDIILLTRRTGGRQSQLIRADGSTELDEGTVIGEGEYPTTNANGQLAFKGWGNTAYGLRVSSAALEDIQTVTNVDEDTAPALSPDGQRVVFMSHREENWDIYIANVDGSNLQRLTTDDSLDGLPAWSPGGNAIAFVSNRGGPWAVWAMTPEGDGKRQLFTMEGSPDGNVGTDTYASRGWAEERISWTAADLN